MNVGIVGFGKMGSEIFDLMMNTGSVSSVTVISNVDIEIPAQKVLKVLEKSLKRKRISEEEFERRKNSFRFSHDLRELENCDLVIECIFEDLQAKRSLFAEVSRITGDRCILATNTSSLSVADIFSDVSEKSMCTGMHFFYPVKLSEYVELNITESTSQKVTDTLSELIVSAGKTPVVFRGKYNIYFNQFISYCVSSALKVSEDRGYSITDGKNVLSQLFPLHGLFGIADSTGLGLLTANGDSFAAERIKPVIRCGTDIMKALMNEGCSGEPGALADFLVSNGRGKKISDADGFISDIAAVVLNEAVYAAGETGMGIKMISALESIIGMDDSMSVYYKKYGYEEICTRLSGLNTDSDLFVPAEKSLYEEYLG